MMNGLWGKKVGMTQVFAGHKVVPVTVIDVSDWFITQCKTKERDGYDAVQLGCVRNKYKGQAFSPEWLKDKKRYFVLLREVALEGETASDVTPGSTPSIEHFAAGASVDVFGVTTGHGFQGAVKRHGFSGGRGSHGDKLGRAPGSLSGLRTCGRVFKGKRMPGHMGVTRHAIKNLELIRVESEAGIVMVKGSVPGKTGSLIYMKKRG